MHDYRDWKEGFLAAQVKGRQQAAEDVNSDLE
jgi:hypothetical protein